VVFDESFMIKNPKSLLAQRLLPLTTNARCVLMLSATPRGKSSAELYTQMLPFLGRTVLGDYRTFSIRYASAGWSEGRGFKKWGLGADRYSGEIFALLGHCSIQYFTTELSSTLPPLTRVKEYIDLSAADLAEQRELLDELQKTNYPNPVISQLHRLTAKQKSPYVLKWVEDWLEKKKPGKLVIFSESLEMFDYLEKNLTVGFVRIDGSTSLDDRDMIISQLASPHPTIRIALLTYATCCLGVTLCPDCADVLMASLPYVISYLEQAEKKLHRVGAIWNVQSTWLLARNSHDESVLGTLGKKTENNALALTNKKRFLTFDDEEEVPSKKVHLATTAEAQ